ncbi:MAG: NAD(P)H-hydrate dehydratase [Candidatus Marinimicrobia bacterium]|nr:NAD(P)H-hydrate dehydratase [Candidatus Neomarinimicrobiota bacterium]MCF7839559.1 NAD(P)H-hydrate dehydratase [Candidatus Neomarinimicrobiota bacterium]MCF7901896.1 NAD(P)H-hydrate dehydratase [Candidatus Neomarinimicrobiota bacterium]
MTKSIYYAPMALSKAVDEYAIKTCDIPGEKLMGTAGQKVFEALEERQFLEDLSGPVWVLCGKGNNGGDGFVVATLLAKAGIDVNILRIPDPDQIAGDAAVYFKAARDMDIPMISIFHDSWQNALQSAGLVVDGLLGTGITGTELRPPYDEIITLVNALTVPVVAIDVPSGLSGDFGQVTDPCIQTTLTVTMGYPKAGMLFSPAREVLGELVVAEIGFPSDSLDHVALPVLAYLDAEYMDPFYPSRSRNAHKYQVGKVAIIAGSRGFSGAAILAAEAALRSGAGLVRLAVPEGMGSIAETLSKETIVTYAPETESGGFSLTAEPALTELADWADVVALGPGVGREDETLRLIQNLMVQIEKPLVIDADGLFALAQNPEILKQRRAETVVTPHAGEFQRLLTAAGIEDTPQWQTARQFADDWQCYVLLKGAPSLVATPSGVIFVNSTGNPGMATAGSGDVLTGMIAGLLAQKMMLPEMLNYAMYKHGSAGDVARREIGELGMMAGDIVNAISRVLVP